MVDCRPAAAAPAPHESHSAPPPPDTHHAPPPQTNQQSGGSGDMGTHGVTSPGARASTPAAVNAHAPYTAHYQSPAMNPPVNMAVNMPLPGVGMPPYASYMCPSVGVGAGGKGLVWVPPPMPPPHHVNPHVYKSVQANGADLPMNDIPTLRYYFNLGVDCMWAAYGPPPPPPPRHYSPRDIAQDMQAMTIQDRGNNHNQDMGHKHKAAPSDKPMQNNGKGNGQRSIMGPRFNKRGNGQDGNPNPNHNQHNGRNNNNHMNNKGPNNRTYDRRNSDTRGHPGYGLGALAEGEAPPEAPLLTLPYIPYPPPVYPVQYYPVDSSDPAMMGMMSGMQYVPYEEAVEYAPHYYPPAPAPYHAQHMPPHIEHK